MISITKEELDQYEQLGSGKYGIVYQINDQVAYKIYKETILGKDGFPMINPVLCSSKSRLKRLIKKSKELKYTDLIQDIILLDGHFGGVCIPYYPGCTLETFRHSSYELKKDISKQLIRNNQELKQHFIYPMDYHPGNIMVVNNTAKIIDLDDSLTRICRIPNPLLQKISTSRLNETIQDIFGEYDLTVYGPIVREKLQRKRVDNTPKKNWLDTFLEEKESIQDYLIINEQSNLETVKELLRNHPYRVIYTLKESTKDWNKLLDIIEHLKVQGINLFDFTLEERLERYFQDFPSDNKILVKEDAHSIKKGY